MTPCLHEARGTFVINSSGSYIYYVPSRLPETLLPSIMASHISRSALRTTAQFARSRAIPQSSFASQHVSPVFRRFLATPTEQPRLRLGTEAPNFSAKTTQGDIDFHQWLGGSWAILFSHPADFTPVCTTELGAFARMRGEFEKRNVKMIGLVSTYCSFHRVA